MKEKFAILFLLLTIDFVVFAQQQNVPTDGAKIQFEIEVMDYGTIEQNSNGDRKFKFKNVGNAPLIISNVQGSCGCLVLKWPKEPIMPGKTGVIVAHYDTQRIGKFEKTFTVTSNAFEQPFIVLKVKGVVFKPLVDSVYAELPK
ncbi:MAG: DUF1573 domain-containing protein [Bacteroidia bacterium]|nr:DUF1573 domain-containing protein [Bacteroidia bacterium]